MFHHRSRLQELHPPDTRLISNGHVVILVLSGFAILLSCLSHVDLLPLCLHKVKLSVLSLVQDVMSILAVTQSRSRSLLPVCRRYGRTTRLWQYSIEQLQMRLLRILANFLNHQPPTV